MCVRRTCRPLGTDGPIPRPYTYTATIDARSVAAAAGFSETISTYTFNDGAGLKAEHINPLRDAHRRNTQQQVLQITQPSLGTYIYYVFFLNPQTFFYDVRNAYTYVHVYYLACKTRARSWIKLVKTKYSLCVRRVKPVFIIIRRFCVFSWLENKRK